MEKKFVNDVHAGFINHKLLWYLWCTLLWQKNLNLALIVVKKNLVKFPAMQDMDIKLNDFWG